jgi:hypothetical protein
MVRQLSTLPVLHYVYGGILMFAAVVIIMFCYATGTLLMSDLITDEDPTAGIAGGFIQGFGIVVGVLMLMWGLLVVLSGRWIAQARHRTGSLVIAALCCLSVPFGTALGIYTIIVLSNDEVLEAYGIRPRTIGAR